MNNIQINTEYVTLGQLLKMTDAISSGGMAKWFLSENEVLVNGESEYRRGRKLRDGDVINIPGSGAFRVVEQTSGQ
ncbi:S4 domain-containing protein YaaA [Paenisporosarcina sp. TG20]|uniref:S4 domain-containing protein YaaA n=1 Tax=Paenisporosarcina sp. TG20 TaxID=1211706 RepID=UPI000316F018|nr:S4 domain-containing protein YaaA [Paenisporosarcina sp. TG20]